MLAKIKDYGVSLTAAKLPQIVVQFELVEDGKTYTWWGSLKDAAKEWTIKSLMKMGFSADTLEPIALGLAGGALNNLQEYDIQVETKPDQHGKMQSRVSWINLPGESAIRGKLEAPEAVAALKGMGSVKGDILAIKKALPVTTAQATGTDGDVPF